MQWSRIGTAIQHISQIKNTSAQTHLFAWHALQGHSNQALIFKGGLMNLVGAAPQAITQGLELRYVSIAAQAHTRLPVL
jgi:hypothetical protein